MDRIGFDVTTTAQEFNINDDKVVDMIKILSNAIHGVLGIASSDNHVAGSTEAYLSGDVSSKVKMSLAPFYKDLEKR